MRFLFLTSILLIPFFAIVAVVPSSSLAATTIDLELVGPMSPRNQAAWWSPIAVHDGSVYVSYLAANSPQDDVFVAKRTGPGTWTTRDTGFNAGYDPGHTQTSLAIDGEGKLHLFYGMHNHEIRYAQSNQLLSVTDGFTGMSPPAFGSGARYTYPNTTTAPNGDVYVIIRDQRSSYSAQQGRLFRYQVANDSWSELPPFAGQNGTTVYPDQIVADAMGQLHIVWEWAAGGAQAARHYGSYARFDPNTNTYYRANGTTYATNPINVAQADIYQGLEGSETFAAGVHGVQSAKLTLDDQGRPMIAYGYSLTGTDAGYEHRLARWTGTEWVRSTVTSGPFDSDKSWLAFSDGMLRYYGTLSPNSPAHTGSDDIFMRTSTDYGATWSTPVVVTRGLNVQRPVGVTVGGTDYLYLPDITAGKMYVGIVQPALPPQGTFPYTNDFTSGGFPHATTAFILNTTDGNLHYQRAAGGGVVVDTASVPLAGVSGSDFVVSTRFTLNSDGVDTGGMSTIGLGLFGTGSQFTGAAADPYYLADIIVNGPEKGRMRILALPQGKEGFTSSGNVAGPVLEEGETYELRLTGDYAHDGTLTMTLQMYDEAGDPLGPASTATDASPLAGEYFGLRNRLVPNSGTTNVSYHHFNVTESSVKLGGDFDGDGDVDGRDFLLWQRDPSLGNLADWQANYGVGMLASLRAVPEPGTSLLCASVLAAIIFSSRPYWSATK